MVWHKVMNRSMFLFAGRKPEGVGPSGSLITASPANEPVILQSSTAQVFCRDLCERVLIQENNTVMFDLAHHSLSICYRYNRFMYFMLCFKMWTRRGRRHQFYYSLKYIYFYLLSQFHDMFLDTCFSFATLSTYCKSLLPINFWTTRVNHCIRGIRVLPTLNEIYNALSTTISAQRAVKRSNVRLKQY